MPYKCMKIYNTYCRLELTYTEIIAYAYSFKEVLLINSETDLDVVLRLYFDNGQLKAEQSDLLKESIPDDIPEYMKEILFRDNIEPIMFDKNIVLIPYISGTWKQIKEGVSEVCLWKAGKEGISCAGDPLKLDRSYILNNLYIYEGKKLLYYLTGDVRDRCVAYCVQQDFPLDSRSFVWPDDIDKAMKKWEKMKS